MKNIVLSDILTVSTLAKQSVAEGESTERAEALVKTAFTGENAVAYEDAKQLKEVKLLGSEGYLKAGETHYLIVKIDMDEAVGNEANHNGINIPTIHVGIDVLATQYTYEKDTFGDQYDKDATYPKVYDHKVMTFSDLKAAFAAGGSILVLNDIEWEELIWLKSDKEVYLDLNGKKMTPVENMTSTCFLATEAGSKLTIDGNGTFDFGARCDISFLYPCGNVTIENGTYVRNRVTGGSVRVMFIGAKSTSSNVVINGGYFDNGYYDANAAYINGILDGTVEFVETKDDIAKRGNSGDKNMIRVAIKNNVTMAFNHSGYGSFKIYGGTFVGANPAWGDEGCMLPTTPDYLRPWSYYQGAFLDGQEYHEDGIVLPEGYTITEGTTEDGRPTYAVTYSK